MSYQSHIKIQPGQKGPEIMIFALSTCVWCQKTKALLAQLGLEYRYLDVDLLMGADQQEAAALLETYNSSGSFPTLIVGAGEEVIVGFKEDELRKLAKG